MEMNNAKCILFYLRKGVASQEQMAVALGVSVKTLGNFERGKAGPGMKLVNGLSRLLEINTGLAFSVLCNSTESFLVLRRKLVLIFGEKKQ